MEKKWKNFLIFVVLAVAAGFLVLYLSLPPETTFRDGIRQIDSIWANESINPANLTSAEIQLLDYQSLFNVTQGLDSLKKKAPVTNQGAALSALANVHLSILEILAVNKELSKELSETDSLDISEICGNSAKFEGINSSTKDLAGKIKEKNMLISDFSSKYPEYYPQADIEKFISDEGGIDIALLESGQGLQELKSSCGGLQ